MENGSTHIFCFIFLSLLGSISSFLFILFLVFIKEFLPFFLVVSAKVCSQPSITEAVPVSARFPTGNSLATILHLTLNKCEVFRILQEVGPQKRCFPRHDFLSTDIMFEDSRIKETIRRKEKYINYM